MVVATTSTTEPALAAIVPGTQQPVSTATITPLLPPAPSPTAGGLLVSLRLNSRRVLVIGGGKEAVGRIFNSLDAGATVHLLAPYEDLLPQVKAFVDDGKVTFLNRRFEGPKDLRIYDKPTATAATTAAGGSQSTPTLSAAVAATSSYFFSAATGRKSPTPSAEILREEPYSLYDIVLGCSDDHDESVAIAKAARDARIPVNCADVPDLCDFYFVALHRDGPLQVGVSTNGCGPRMAARIRNMIREALPKCTGAAIAAVGRLRTKVKMLDADLANAGRRMSWVSKFCDLWEMEELAAMNDDDMEKILDAYEKGEEPPRKTGVLVAGGATAATGGPAKQQLSTARGLVPSTLAGAMSLPKSAVQSAAAVAVSAAGLVTSVATLPWRVSTSIASASIHVATATLSTIDTTLDSKSGMYRLWKAKLTGHHTSALLHPSRRAEPDPAHSSPATNGTPPLDFDYILNPKSAPSPSLSGSRGVIFQGHHAGPTLYLVGGGPGDPGLLTLRGYHALQSADVIVSDQLISEELIAVIPKHARLVFVERKVKGRSDAAQTDANLLCLEELQKLASTPGLRGGGGSVVRLKGGDPFLFGRGGEEALFMRDAGFRVVVVPGVTSSIAAPASAGIPVTHRGVADQVLVVSARGEGGSLPDIPPYAPRRTIVVLMPVARMAVLAELMMGGGGGGGGDGEEGRGFPPDTPAAVVERGTCVDERVVEGTLRNIAARIADAAVGSPALLVVGDVCSVLRTSV